MPKRVRSRKTRPGLLRKVILLFLLNSAMALGIIFFFRAGYPMPLLDLISLDAAVLGLTSGLGTRIILKKRGTPLQLLAAWSALAAGLLVLGYFSNWKYGMGPLVPLQKYFDWSGLIQLVIGMISAVLVMFAWPRTRIRSRKKRSGARAGNRRAIPADRAVLNGAGLPDIREKTSALRTASQPPQKSGLAGRGRHARVRTSPVGSHRRNRKAEVQFKKSEEHRCPYCLEIVRPNDPRGVVECNICHAMHHADCWAITGVCQVPHLNS